MVRRFRYYAKPEEIRKYLEELGYEIEERCTQDGKEATGFDVRNTTVGLSYDPIVRGHVVGYGMIGLKESTLDPDPNNPNNMLVNSDPERYETSLRLYRKLQRQFGKKGHSKASDGTLTTC